MKTTTKREPWTLYCQPRGMSATGRWTRVMTYGSRFIASEILELKPKHDRYLYKIAVGQADVVWDS